MYINMAVDYSLGMDVSYMYLVQILAWSCVLHTDLTLIAVSNYMAGLNR